VHIVNTFCAYFAYCTYSKYCTYCTYCTYRFCLCTAGYEFRAQWTKFELRTNVFWMGVTSLYTQEKAWNNQVNGVGEGRV
jgi:hypothetical protein